MADDKAEIDGYLGDGTYDDWIDLQQQRAQVEMRYHGLVAKLGAFANVGGVSLDFTQLADIGDLYDEGMEAVAKGTNVNHREAEIVNEMYHEALTLAETDNDLLAMLIGAAFFDALTMLVRFPAARLQRMADNLRISLAKLSKQIEIAEKERSGAITQTIINVVTLVVLPEVGVVIGLGKLFGKLVMDDLLGPKKPGAIGDASNVTESFGQFAESASKLDSVGKNGPALGKVGKGAGVAGLAFDAYEVFKGYSNVREIKAAQTTAMMDLRSINALLKRYLPGVIAIRQQIAGMQTRALRNRRDAEAARRNISRLSDEARTINRGRWWQDMPAPSMPTPARP